MHLSTLWSVLACTLVAALPQSQPQSEDSLGDTVLPLATKPFDPNRPAKAVPSKYATIPSDYQQPSYPATANCGDYDPREPYLDPCMWAKYKTSQWLQDYIKDLLAREGKKNTKDLMYEWPVYLMLEYYDLEWQCYWNSLCDIGVPRPEILPTDSPQEINNKINAFFVLQSISHWVAYIMANANVVASAQKDFIESTEAHYNLDAIIQNFTPQYPDNSGDIKAAQQTKLIVQGIAFVASKIPLPGAEAVGGAIDFLGGFIEIPGPPPVINRRDELKARYVDTVGNFTEAFAISFSTLGSDSDYAIRLLDSGMWLPLPLKESREVWQDARVRALCNVAEMSRNGQGIIEMTWKLRL
jgi:hypothetical protein